MRSQETIFLSLSDVFSALKQLRKVLYLGPLVVGLFCFGYLVTRPITFTSTGIFKGKSSKPEHALSKALELVDENESYLPDESPLSFLHSYPVIAAVVDQLDLQATLVEKQSGSFIRKVLKVLKTEYGYFKLKKQKIPARILDRSVYVPQTLIIPDKAPTLSCQSVSFSSETFTTLKIVFENPTQFVVWENHHKIGSGSVEYPFAWENGTFTLNGLSKIKKVVYLNLIPKQRAVESVAKRLKIKKNKKNPGLVHITYTHPDRHLAASIVNETMTQYQQYLQDEGKRKILSQLAYLEQRHQDTLGKFETAMDLHRDYLESHLDSGMMLSLAKEIEFMSQKQAEKRQEMLNIAAEIERLSSHLGENDQVNAESLNSQFTTLTIPSAHKLLNQYEQQIDALQLEQEKLDESLSKLRDEHFNLASISKMISDSSLLSSFEHLNALNRQLVDEKNWAQKEKELLKTEIETEKHFIQNHISHLKQGTSTQEQVIRKRVHALQKALVHLLNEAYKNAESDFQDLCKRSTHFPEKWLNEQKIELNTKLYKEMMESITKMIEVKNIRYHLDYLEVGPLEGAQAPVVPNHPHLLLGTFLGALGGCILILFGICFYRVWQGPLASKQNLESQRRFVCPQKDTIKHIGLTLANQKQSPTLLITSKCLPSIKESLAEWFSSRGENIFTLKLCKDFHLKPEYLEELKREYTRILIIFQGNPLEIETLYLVEIVDAVIYGVSDETLAEVEKLPQKTLFYFEQPGLTQLSLKLVRPKLAKLLRSVKISSASFLQKSF